MKNKFTTIKNIETSELVVKKSRFIANVSPIYSVNEANEFIEKIRKEHKTATHNVFAYRIGEKNEEKYTDDGEPSKTAGFPILDMLKKGELENIIVVVTRYFGGTELGTGGLVHAYTNCAKEGIEKAEITQMVLHSKLSITCNYTLSGKVQYETLQQGNTILDTIYTDDVTFIIVCISELVDEYIKSIVNVTNDLCDIEKIEELYISVME